MDELRIINDLDRAPSKGLRELKKFGYTFEEIENTLKNMLAMTLEELNEIKFSNTSTAIESIMAALIIRSFNSESFFRLEYILDKVFGKAVGEDLKGKSNTKVIEIVRKKIE